MAEKFAYPIDFGRDASGHFRISFPDLPDVTVIAGDLDEVCRQAEIRLTEEVAALIVDRQNVPTPSPVRGRRTVPLRTVMAAKVALNQAMRVRRMTRVALAQQLGCGESEVRRLLDPRHTSKIGRLEDALAALGLYLVIEVRSS